MRAPPALLLLALAACSGKGCRSGSGLSAESTEACADLATRSCNRLAFCAPLSLAIAYGDIARCIDRTIPVCISALQAKGSGQAPSRVRSCAQAYDTARCEDIVVGKAPPSCTFPGTLGLGEVCGDDSQCGSPHGYCRLASDQTCGTCSTLGTAGAGCFSDRDCDDGLVCYFTCVAPVGLGEACDGMARQCPSTQVCLNYTCAAPGQAGAPCNPRADHCDRDHGLFCDAQTKACAHYTFADPGAPCGTGTTCRAGACIAAPGTEKSLCVANAADGSECDATLGPPCMAPARCVEGVCRLPDSAGCR